MCSILDYEYELNALNSSIEEKTKVSPYIGLELPRSSDDHIIWLLEN